MTQTIISTELLDRYFGGYSPSERRKISSANDEMYKWLVDGKKPRSLNEQPELISIVGPPGVGKTTLLQRTLAEKNSSASYVGFDPDLIREKLPFFQKTVSDQLRLGLDSKEADSVAMGRWNAAVIWSTQSMVNRAQKDGYNILRAGAMNGSVTTDVCLRTEAAGLQLVTAIVLAPEAVCRESIIRRLQQGGHPVSDRYIDRSFEVIASSLPLLQSRSDRLQYYWRDGVTSSPALVAETGSDRCLIIHQASGYDAICKMVELRRNVTILPKRPIAQILATNKTLG